MWIHFQWCTYISVALELKIYLCVTRNSSSFVEINTVHRCSSKIFKWEPFISLLSTGKCGCPEVSGLRSQSQTLFWWKFSGQMIDQKEEHCTGIVLLLQKREDTSDTEVRLAHGSMRHSSLKKLPYRLVFVILTIYFRC